MDYLAINRLACSQIHTEERGISLDRPGLVQSNGVIDGSKNSFVLSVL